MALLDLQGVEVKYGPIAALQGVSLKVGTGEIVALIGPNGAGKSSTLNAISGRTPVQSGDIRFDGESIIGRRIEANVAAGIAYVPEGRHVFARLTVEENLRLGATVRKDGTIESDIERELERFPALRRLFRKNAGKLSGGEQQQLAIARALISRPRLMLLDEPSLGLAPRIIDEVFAAVAELRTEGVTVLLVEQHAARAIKLADRAYIMTGGEIVMEGNASLLDSRDALEAAYLGRASVGKGGL